MPCRVDKMCTGNEVGVENDYLWADSFEHLSSILLEGVRFVPVCAHGHNRWQDEKCREAAGMFHVHPDHPKCYSLCSQI